MGVFVGMYICTMCMSCVGRDSKRASGPLGVELTDDCESLYVCWELNLIPLEEQPVFLFIEPSIQP